MKKVEPKLQQQLNTLVQSMGYELWGCELFYQGGQKCLRIFIDHISGITVDDCAKVSHQISAFLDVNDPIQGRYSLEVSSPGINRPLFELEHFAKYLGKRVKIKLRREINGRKKLVGTIRNIDQTHIHLMVIDMPSPDIKVPFEEVEKANLIEEIHM